MRFTFLPIAVLAIATAEALDTHQFRCIQGCRCEQDEFKLKIIDCDKPIILTNQTFPKSIKKINLLYLANAHSVRIEKNAFKDFDVLDEVTIENTTVNYIEPSVFELPDLGNVAFINVHFSVNLNLSSNYLEKLTITNSGLTAVPNLDLMALLGTINLSNNRIIDIPVGTFANLINIEEISLTGNQIKYIHPDLFNNNLALNTLYLDKNPLDKFVTNMPSNLELLSLSSCNLTTFTQESTKNLDLVSHLDLGNNHISILPIDAFSGMNKLSFIDLSRNELVEIDDNIFEDNNKLHKIVLDDNHFQKLPKFATKDKKFQTYIFSCNRCNIDTLEIGTFDEMPALSILRLANNHIRHIDNVLKNIYALKELDLSGNEINGLGQDTFASNNYLEIVNLSRNPLTTLDPLVFKPTIIKRLDVSNSQLNELWSNKKVRLTSLEKLLFGNNSLEKISVQDLEVTPNLKLIDLNGNPLICDKDLHDSITWLIQKSVYPLEGEDSLKTHDNLIVEEAADFEQTFNEVLSWKIMAYNLCDNDTIFDYDIKESTDVKPDEGIEYKSGTPTDKPKNEWKYDDEYYDYYDNYDDDDDDDDVDNEIKNNLKENENGFNANLLFNESMLQNKNVNLTRAFYVLSITSVFVLTALVVLTIAVTITLLILRRNRNFDMQRSNLPRLRIPLWNTTPAMKKHSGSVYRPLSEDLTGPKTPKVNRYEFKSTPTVHNAIP